jgi:hypothetical protein
MEFYDRIAAAIAGQCLWVIGRVLHVQFEAEMVVPSLLVLCFAIPFWSNGT